MPLHVSSARSTAARSLEERRVAIADALRAVRSEPAVTAAAGSVAAPKADPPARDEALEALATQVRRLAERVERVEDTVDLLRSDTGDEPLAWPVAVGDDTRLEVPPVEVSRRASPAFDVLFGSDG